MPLRPFVADESLIGQFLPCDLYTVGGVLVAAAGSPVADEADLRRLTRRPLYRRAEQESSGPALPQALAEVEATLATTLSTPGTTSLAEPLASLAEQLIALVAEDGDAVLGLLRHLPVSGFAVRHCLLVAAVVAMLGEECLADETERRASVAAALSMNIAALELHEHLARGLVPHDEASRATIHAHPQAGAERLAAAGVTDPLWLDGVRQHHEHLDGSGYPAGLHGEAIGRPARLLRVADYYCAKISARHYRPPQPAGEALRQLFGAERERLDTPIAIRLLHRLGALPPGTLVILANHETAVVARRQPHRETGLNVVSFLDYRNQPLERLIHRDTTHSAFAIRRLTEPAPNWPAIRWETLWGY